MRTFEAVLRRWGRPAELHSRTGSMTGLAMVQPLFEKDIRWMPTPLGRQRRDRFLYIGEPTLAVDELGEEGYVVWEGQAYEVETAQTLTLGRRVLYRWAVLTVREAEV